MSRRRVFARSLNAVPRHAHRLLVALAVTVLLGACASGAETIQRLTIENPTSYDFEVQVKGADGGGWTLLGRVGRDASSVAEQVPDHGDVWIFQFRFGPRVAGELRVPRAELASNDWVVEVPKEVGERLRSEGHEPSVRLG